MNNIIDKGHISAIIGSNDIIDVLDEQGNKTGKILPRQEVHRLGKLHRVVHLYLLEQSSFRLLLQRRASSLTHFPNKLSISVTGHVQSGEDSLQAMKRELKEELGIDASKIKIDFLFTTRQNITLSSIYIDRQFNDIYLGWANFTIDEIQFNPREVCEVMLIHCKEFESMLLMKQQEFSYPYNEIWKKILPYIK